MQQEQQRAWMLRVEIRECGSHRQCDGVEDRIRFYGRTELDVGGQIRASLDRKDRITLKLTVVGVMTVVVVMIRRAVGVVMRMSDGHHPYRQLACVAEQGKEHEDEHE